MQVNGENVPMDDAYFEHLLSRLSDEDLERLIEKCTAERGAQRSAAG
jgi:hypothetical protein